MSKKFRRIISVILVTIVSFCNSSVTFALDESQNTFNESENIIRPVEFNGDLSIDEIVFLIEQSYMNNISIRMANSGNQWGKSETTYDGTGGHYVTTRFWVNGNDIDGFGTNCVIRAEKQAVIDKYGSVNKNYEYKLETTQHIVMSVQTQGYVTVSAKSTCYGRRAK